MTIQHRKKGESIDAMLRKFKRKVKNDGTLQEVRSREFFENNTETKKRKLKAAQKRTRQQQRLDEL